MTGNLSSKIFVRHSVNLSNEVLKRSVEAVKKGEIIKGHFIEKFEVEFAKYIGVKYALGVSSGRMGLYLAFKLLDFKKDDEIIIPDYTLCSIPALIKAYGLKPVFVDVCPDTYNIDISLIKQRITSKTKAILATHLFGHPCEIAPILKIAKDYGLKIIEDCAQSCGAEYKNRKVGSYGDLSIFSFNVGKNLCCFGGGMLVSNDDYLGNKINNIRTECRDQDKSKLFINFSKTLLVHAATSRTFFPFTLYPMLRFLDFFGIDFIDRLMEEKVVSWERILPKNINRLANLQAEWGLIQLERLDSINAKLRENAELLNSRLREIKQIKIPKVILDAKSIYLYYKIEIEKRKQFRKLLLKRGVDTKSDDMSACSTLDIFKDCRAVCPVSEKIHRHSLEIPNSIYLNREDILYICKQIKETVGEIQNAL